MTKRSLRLALCLVTLAATLRVGPATAQTRVREARCDLDDTLQQAIERSRVGDVIIVMGTCNENVFVPSSKVGITIRGGHQGAGIRGRVQNQSVVAIAASGVTVEDLAIKGIGDNPSPDDFGGAGISVFDGASARIVSCVIEDNRAEGVSINSAQAVLSNNVIRNNNQMRSFALGGVSLVFNASAKFFNNTIRENALHGVVVRAQSNVFFSGDSIRDNHSLTPPQVCPTCPFLSSAILVTQMSLVNFEGARVIISGSHFGLGCDNDSRFSASPGAIDVSTEGLGGEVLCTTVR